MTTFLVSGWESFVQNCHLIDQNDRSEIKINYEIPSDATTHGSFPCGARMADSRGNARRRPKASQGSVPRQFGNIGTSLWWCNRLEFLNSNILCLHIIIILIFRLQFPEYPLHTLQCEKCSFPFPENLKCKFCPECGAAVSSVPLRVDTNFV